MRLSHARYSIAPRLSITPRATEAALDFIAKNNTVANKYRLHRTTDNDPQKNYYDVFTSDPVMSNEYILSRSVWNTLNLVYFNGPCGFSGKLSNTGYNNPTQNLVDAYETTKGLTIENDPDYDPQNPYANRDPRLAQTIFHHGMTWGDGDEARQLDMHIPDGIDYSRGNGGTCTGYYCKKYVHNIRFDGTVGNQRVACPIFRYAEILLNAAEALTEAGQASLNPYSTNAASSYASKTTASSTAAAGSSSKERLPLPKRICRAISRYTIFTVSLSIPKATSTTDCRKNTPHRPSIHPRTTISPYRSAESRKPVCLRTQAGRCNPPSLINIDIS